MSIVESPESKMLQNGNSLNQTSMPLMGQDISSPAGKRAAREILLLCTTASISPGRKERISQLLVGPVDWRYLLDLVEFHGVAPMIAHNLATSGLSQQVPQPYSERLNRIYNGMLYRNVILSNELIKVLSAFNQHGIATITLKGTILSEQLYGNPALRIVGDMDILVKPEELSLAGSLLQEMGYEQYAAQDVWEHPFHDIYYKQAQFPLLIELHWNLDDRRLVAFPEREIWQRSQELQIQGGSTMVLSPEDNLLFLSNHLIKQDKQLLRALCDITELLKKYEGVLDWDYIVDSAHSWGIENAVYYSLGYCKELISAPVPEYAITGLRPKVWRRCMLDFLISRETFISPIKWYKLRRETKALYRSLMTKHLNKMVLVLTKYRGRGKRIVWLRTTTWIMLVFIAALGRNAVRFLSGWR